MCRRNHLEQMCSTKCCANQRVLHFVVLRAGLHNLINAFGLLKIAYYTFKSEVSYPRFRTDLLHDALFDFEREHALQVTSLSGHFGYLRESSESFTFLAARSPSAPSDVTIPLFVLAEDTSSRGQPPTHIS